MALEPGIVCGQCDRLNPLSNESCSECGFELALSRVVARAESTASVAAAGAPRDTGSLIENVPPAAAPTGAEEKPMEQARHFVCPSCYSPVPTGHKFCGKCGTPVDEAVAAKDPSYFGEMQTPGKAKLILIKGEGMDGISYHLNSDEHIAGREEGAILFTEDRWLSPKHANFYYDAEGRLVVRDEGSTNGVFCCLRSPLALTAEDVFLCGEQLFRVEEIPPFDESPDPDGTYFFASPRKEASFRVVQLLEGGGDGLSLQAVNNAVMIGREECDMNFPNDPYISGQHAKVELTQAGVQLTDMGSKNGTYVRIQGEQALNHGDYVFLGRQLLRVEITS